MTVSINPVAKTPKGKLAGSFEDGLYVFRGVPYAQPPVGSLRWLPPRAVKPWTGVHQAQQYGAIPPQNVMAGLRGDQQPQPQSEDCLFLNLYTPALDNHKRPVMVWFHGGAFSMGAGSNPNYRSGSLTKRGDLVLVTINYRLGALGFLNLKAITAGKIPVTGNQGLLDQIAALEWIKSNIAAFGGDPDNVTLFGESAGGMSVASLMCMPKAQRLFHKVIIESAMGAIARPLQESIKIAETFYKVLGLKNSEPEALRALSVDKILKAQQEVAAQTRQTAPWMPVADGKILPLMPLEAFAQGKASPVPTLVGSNLDEQKFFSLMDPSSKNLDEKGLTSNLFKIMDSDKAVRVVDLYRKQKVKRGENASPFELFSAIKSDLFFRQIAIYIAQCQARNSVPAYNYLFTWKSPAAGGSLGACHTLEVGFVFGTLDPVFCGKGPAAEKLSGEIQDAWIAFVTTGNPSSNNLGKWPKYTAARSTMILSEQSHLAKAAYEEERKIWGKVGEVNLG